MAQLNPKETLARVAEQNPASVLVLFELPSGSLELVTGPDMTLEHINFLLDEAKSFIMFRNRQPVYGRSIG